MSTPHIQMIPDGYFVNKDLERLLLELHKVVEQREVMHRKEAADFLGINIRTLDRLASEGSIPYHKLKGMDGTRLYLKSELLEHLKKH